jgi:hypothetical protein
MVNEEAEGYKAAGNALVGKKKYSEAVKKYELVSCSIIYISV